MVRPDQPDWASLTQVLDTRLQEYLISSPTHVSQGSIGPQDALVWVISPVHQCDTVMATFQHSPQGGRIGLVLIEKAF